VTAPVLIQSNSTFVSSGTSVQVTLPSPSIVGNTYLAYGSCLSAQTTLAFSDTVNGVYTIDVTNGGAGPHTAVIARVPSIGNGSPTLTLSSTAAGNGIRIALQEWQGLATSVVLDQFASGFSSGGSTAPATGASGVLSQSGELVVCYGVSAANVTWTAGGSFTLDPNINQTNATRGVEYLIAGSTAAQTGSFTINTSQTWNALLATYLPFSQPSSDTMTGQFWI